MEKIAPPPPSSLNLYVIIYASQDSGASGDLPLLISPRLSLVQIKGKPCFEKQKNARVCKPRGNRESA